MIPVAAIRFLADRGLTAADIADLCDLLEPPRSSGAERQARYRRRHAERNESDVTRDVTRDVTGPSPLLPPSPPPSLPPTPPNSPPPISPPNPTPPGDADFSREVDWKARLEEARAIAGDGLDPTAVACLSYRDLRALTDPASGEPCDWGEVLDAVTMVAARAKARGRPIRTWQWVREDAIALRDRRLAGLPDPAANVVNLPHARGSPVERESFAERDERLRREAVARMLEARQSNAN